MVLSSDVNVALYMMHFSRHFPFRGQLVFFQVAPGPYCMHTAQSCIHKFAVIVNKFKFKIDQKYLALV